MDTIITPHRFSGDITIPASKSHTIRRLIIASLAGAPDVSVIERPLDSLDARSCAAVCQGLGARVEERPDGEGNLAAWVVRGVDHSVRPAARLDVGNSGTTLYLCMAAAGLFAYPIEFDGDDQIRRRSAAALIGALRGLGVGVDTTYAGNADCAPLTVRGPWKGGRVTVSCPTSQYLSALLIAAPCAPAGAVTEIDVSLLNERPYVEMTLSYLDAQGIPYQAADDFSYFRIPGGAKWKAVSGHVPGDFSSAAFPACAAAVSGGKVTLRGLDPADTQGDKAIFPMLEKMGAKVIWSRGGDGDRDGEWAVTVEGGPLRGGFSFDLNTTPDMLPAAAVLAAFAEGDTSLRNVAHARIKETDRIAVMAAELAKLGVRCDELPDGLVIHGTGQPIAGGQVESHGDHRVAMALAAAACGASGPVTIAGAESAAITYPGFMELVAKNSPGNLRKFDTSTTLVG